MADLFHDRVSASMKATHWTASMDNRTLFEAPFDEAFYAVAKEVLRSTHSVSTARARLREFVGAPDRRTARRLVGSAWHAARLPVVRRRLQRVARPNPRAVPLSW